MAQRPLWARIGLTVLNLWAAGLGILRTGPLRTAALFLLFPLAGVLLFWAYFRAAGELGFLGWAVAMAGLILVQLGAWIGAMLLTWRRSRERPVELPFWSRWYAIAAAAIAMPLLMLVATEMIRGEIRNFYIPSEAMMPTFVKNDRLVASMRIRTPLRRGDIILLRMPSGAIYIKRLAALPGDRIAVDGGIVILNGRPVEQRFLREETAPGAYGPAKVRRLAERFPGEARDHEIYDTGLSDVDDMPERLIPPGYLFVMGDNRDRSADSRVPKAAMGVELLAEADVVGRPLFYTWGPSGKLGERLSNR